MNEALIAITILWTFIFIYAMIGSVDFGAGFWAMLYESKKESKAGVLVNRFLSPTWEITNVFLVLLFVSVFSFFPNAVKSLGSALLIPGSLILILLTLRSAFMVFSFTTERYKKILKYISGISGLLIPGLLISVLPITAGGFISENSAGGTLMMGKLFTSVTEYMYLAFGLASELFLSALFLADYARESGEERTYRTFRRHAIWLGPMTLITAIFAVAYMDPSAQWLKDNLAEQKSWFTLSFFIFFIAYSALWWRSKEAGQFRGRPRAAVILVIIQYAAATFAYGKAHLPYIIYPNVLVESSVTNSAMLRVLILSYIIGSLVLLPFFIFFWRLFLKNRSMRT